MADRRYSFLYEHRGLLQTDRSAQAPTGDAMKVSDRRFEDLVRRAAMFAYQVKFYGNDNEEQGRWNDLFSLVDEINKPGLDLVNTLEMMESDSSVPPHLALLFAFFKMLLVEQEDLNKLTDRQLEYYFRDILGFRMKQGNEGMVTVFAELARNTLSVGIPKGQLFDAGKDAAGDAITYESIEELRLGRENVALFATYDDSEGFKAERVDGSDSDHSLCIASKLFGVPGQKITVFLGDDEDTHHLLSTLEVSYTSAEGWWTSDHLNYNISEGLSIGGDMPPMAPYDPMLHGEGLSTDYPVIRFVSPGNLGVLPFVFPEIIRNVRVVVENGTPLRLENKYGPVENLPGVNPFGIEGHKGDWFRVVLPFPSDDFDAPVQMDTENKVFDKRESDREGVTYALINNDCDQAYISKEFSLNLLRIMKMETVDDAVIEGMRSGALMAVSPRLTSPVTILSAVYTDDSPTLFLVHPCGVQAIAYQGRLNSDIMINSADLRRGDMDRPETGKSSPSAVYLAFTDADLESGQLSLYFRMKDEALDPAERVLWYYMSENTWTKFKESSILRDSTCGFSQDGTVVLDYQEPMQKGGGGFRDGLTWIKCVCSNGNGKMVAEVRNRAIELTYSKTSKGKGPGGAALPAGTISKTVGSIVGLKKVLQPYDGLTGTIAEDQAIFRRRVAEMLRHKGRAWTPWDYESLVLGEFPEIAYAKCLPSYRNGEIEPGAMTILVIPFSEEDIPVAGDRLINKVKDLLGSVCSPFVIIDVVYPHYEAVKVKTEIVLRRGYNDTVRYEAMANEALQDYLRPWEGYEHGRHFKEGGGVSDIIAFLESLPFVDFVKDIHVYLEQPSGEFTEVDMDGSIEFDDPIAFITSDSNHIVTCKTAN